MKKRIKLNTSVEAETKAGLQKIAKRQKLTDHGSLSKGRAIDYLVAKDLAAGSAKSQTDERNTAVLNP